MDFLLWRIVKNQNDCQISDLRGIPSEKEWFEDERVKGPETADQTKVYGKKFKWLRTGLRASSQSIESHFIDSSSPPTQRLLRVCYSANHRNIKVRPSFSLQRSTFWRKVVFSWNGLALISLQIPEVIEEMKKSKYRVPNIVHFIYFGCLKATTNAYQG